MRVIRALVSIISAFKPSRAAVQGPFLQINSKIWLERYDFYRQYLQDRDDFRS
jgi:hypothetical protein